MKKLNLWTDKLRKIDPYVPGEQSKNIIKLNANENPYPPSPKVTEAIQHFPVETLKLYPNANASLLKETLANYHHLSSDQVFVGNGSDDVLALAFQACFNSEKPVVFPDITYSFYPVWCSLFKIPYCTLPLTEDFRMNPKDYAKENGGVILPNPNAPTGISEGKAVIKEILNQNQDVVVLIDEAYVDFGGYSSIELLKEYENLLIIHTFSKSRSLAGMRIGAAFGNKELIQVLEAVKNSYNSYTMDSIAIKAGAASILDEAYFQQTLSKIKTTRERVSTALQSLGFHVCPSHSNFLFITKENIDAKALFEFLKEQNIFIRYFNLPRIDSYLRITIGTDTEMDLFLEAVTKYLSAI